MSIYNVTVFNASTACILGANSSSKVGEELNKMGCKRALICTDRNC